MNPLKTSNYIDGKWTEAHGESFHSLHPATLKIFWSGKKSSRSDVKTAVQAARKATLPWVTMGIDERQKILKSFAKQIELHLEQLIFAISEETGKPRWEAKTEVQAVIAKIDISIRAYTERMQQSGAESTHPKISTSYKPHGVMVVLGPFNFPAHLSNGHIVPALLAGNTIVYKPSELTPGVAALITACWEKSGLPDGTLNLVHGDAECAQWLLEEDIQGVLFTGSNRAGLYIHQHFASRPDVMLALEMGGNNPLIVDHLENIPAAVYQTILSSFITTGQRCSCARRVLIPDNAFGKEFLRNLQETTARLVIGSPDQAPEPFLGPVIRLEHAQKHLQAQQALLDQGAVPLQPMTALQQDLPFLTPGIIDMSDVSNPPDEEIFGPLIQIYRYANFEEAIRLANQTRYGLTAGLLSDHQEHYEIFYTRLKAGLIYWNRATTGASSELPFGGVGLSGNHRPSAFFATDYCAYPVANMAQTKVTLPITPLPGILTSYESL